MKRTEHGREEDYGSKEDMSLEIECFVWKEELLDDLEKKRQMSLFLRRERRELADLSTDKKFQWQCGEHVQTKCEPGNVDHGIILIPI